jgi:hypothetical protein
MESGENAANDAKKGDGSRILRWERTFEDLYLPVCYQEYAIHDGVVDNRDPYSRIYQRCDIQLASSSFFFSG